MLFAIDLKTRRVELAGITPHPTEAFMAQVARNLTDPAGKQTMVGEVMSQTHRAMVSVT